MLIFPNAKINIGLSVKGKRVDGYHDLETCFYPIGWSDILEIIPSDVFSFTQTGIVVPGIEHDNLCVRAFKLMAAHYDIPPVSILLHKNIPMGAGLGGGSSDATHTLILLNKLFELGVPEEKLLRLALSLGSDCPFFIKNTPVLAFGRGEKFHSTKLSLKGLYIVVIFPGFPISTKEAFSGISSMHMVESWPLEQLAETPIQAWPSVVVNDFERALLPKYPILSSLKQSLYEQGALYTSMTGSGSTIFGIFDSPKSIQVPQHMSSWSGYLD